MSVVTTIIQLKHENGLTFEKRLEIKESGIPRPHLQIKQIIFNKNKQFHRYYHPNMYESADWLCGCEVVNAFFCFSCLLFSDDSTWSKNGVNDLKHLKDKVHKHALSTNHMKSSMAFATLSRTGIPLQSDREYRESLPGVSEQFSKNRYILNTIIDCIKFCGAFELPIGGYDEIGCVENPSVFQGLVSFKDNLDKTTVLQGISKSMQDNLLQSMLAVVHEQIKSEIEHADFLAVQVEEVTDCSNKTQMACIFRYVFNGTVHERFWRFIIPLGTENLTDIILGELDYLNVSKTREKLIAQCFTHASLMSKKFGSLQSRIKQNYPSADFIHCYAHRPNFILQKIGNQYKTLRIFFANLHNFSLFFGESKRTAILDEIVKIRSPTTYPVTWNFNMKCVETVFKHQDDILACLEMIMDNEEDYNTLNNAVSLKSYLQNEEFLYWLNFFYVLTPYCNALFTQIQERYIGVRSIKNYIVNFKDSIEKIRCKMLIDASDDPCETTPSKRPKREDSQSQIALEVCDIVLSEMHHRFEFSTHLIVAQLFYNEKFGEYRRKFPEEICWLVQMTYPIINSTKLKTELEVLYERDDFNISVGLIAILQLLVNHNLCNTFSESVKLLKILCTLPMTTVENERCFSTLERVKTFLYNSVERDRLCALATLSMEKVFIRNIPRFNQQVIDHFTKSKDRQIDLIFKSE